MSGCVLHGCCGLTHLAGGVSGGGVFEALDVKAKHRRKTLHLTGAIGKQPDHYTVSFIIEI